MIDLWIPPKPAIIISAPKERHPPALGLTLLASSWALRSWRPATTSTPPTIVAVGTVAASSSSLSVPYYAGLAANDIAILFTAGISNPTIGGVAGFTALTQITQSAETAMRLQWSRLTGSESGSVTVAHTGGNNSKGVMIGIRGAIASGTPYEGLGTSQAASGTTQTSAALVTTVPNTLGLRFGCNVDADDTTGSPPSGWTEQLEHVATNVTTITIDSKTITSAGTEPASSRTVYENNWIVQTLAILPA